MKMKKRDNILILLAAMIAAVSAYAADADETAATKQSAEYQKEAPKFKQAMPQTDAGGSKQFKWGGDFRFRTVYMDNIPNIVGTETGARSFQRYRTRLFGEYHPTENLYFRTRLVNEFRTDQTENLPDDYAAFDETVIDCLYVDYTHDMFDVRIGRQDLIYGTGKVILDGTPMDGSRTIYFDAAKVTFKGIENTKVDLLAMYTRAINELAIHSQDRNLVWNVDPTYDHAEAGGGIYIKNNSSEKLPWEAYWILKTKEDTGPVTPFENTHTLGTRLMPKLGGNLTSNLEMAYQSNESTDGFMIDAVVNLSIMEDQKGKLGLGWYHLSNDWNPVFSRWPQYSELYVYAYTPADGGVGRWSNVSMPHIDFSISPMKKLKSDLLLGYMFAPSNDSPAGGHNRGLLFTWWNKFTLKEKMLSDRDKLTGHFLVELMQPGDYYTSNQRDHTASFIRLEISYAF